MSNDDSTAETQRVVINKKYGGFGLSEDAIRWMREQGCEHAEKATLVGEEYPDGGRVRDSTLAGSFGRNIPRDDPHLIEVVNQMGDDANGPHANLKVVEIPADVEWEIDEYDGFEQVEEKHRSWG